MTMTMAGGWGGDPEPGTYIPGIDRGHYITNPNNALL